jgi:DNA-binding NarL/FixJ family response regulator
VAHELRGQSMGRRFIGEAHGREELTARELEVLQLAAHGLSARQVAERLTVSPATVRSHLENIYPKLGVTDKTSAVATALRQGLIR